MLKAGFVSLGCAKNLVDTEVMLGILAENSIQITSDPAEADIIIVNTCGFIDTAKEESITTILKMAAYQTEGKCRGVIAAGCLGERYQADLLKELPEIAAIVGTGAWHRIMEAVNAVLAGRRVVLTGDNQSIYDDTMPRINTLPFYSAYVKIAEGCDNCCSYCVIPSVRGKFRSRTVESVVSEVGRLANSGVKEINLVAQDTTSYGKDLYGKPSLPLLLKELVKIEGLVFIRLLYCYPTYFSDELLEVMRQEPKICKYIDLPLQHAHDNILKKMNRKDSLREIEKLLAKIREGLEGVVIRTSVIVGFPGETEEEFEFLEEFITKQKFAHVGVFTYSQEENTPAAKMPEQISQTVKEERYHRLMAAQCQISEELNKKLEGSVLDVLIEAPSSGPKEAAAGRSYREAPTVDGRIYVENAPRVQAGEVIKVKITQGFMYDLVGEQLDS
jgi:ribosomal protein S12 methylthiotransferase